jgi:hypothetical protein
MKHEVMYRFVSRFTLEACRGLDVRRSKGESVNRQTFFVLPLYQLRRVMTLLFQDRWQYLPLRLHLERGLWVRFVGLRNQT